MYLSSDGLSDASDYLWRQGIIVPQLAPGGISEFSDVLTVPDLPLGEYHTLFQCDVLNEVAKSDEANNVLDSGILWLNARPDLAITSVALEACHGVSGHGLRLIFAVVNLGGPTAGASWAHVYLSRDRLLDTGDYLWRQGVLIPQLPQGGRFDFNDELIVPDLLPGQYYVFIQCDVLNELPESNEGNNMLDSGAFLVLSRETQAARWQLYW